MKASRAWLAKSRRPMPAPSCTAVGILLGIALAGTAINAQTPSPDPLTDKQIMSLLNKSASWYQSGFSQRRSATTPQDISFADNARLLSEQIIQLVFEFGHKSAGLLASEPASQNNAGAVESRYGSLITEEKGLAAQEAKEQTEIGQLEAARLASLPAKKNALIAALAEKQSALQLIRSRKETLEKFLQFAGGSTNPDDLESQIGALERAIPVPLASGDKSTDTTAAPANSGSPDSSTTEDRGLWASVRSLFELYRKRQEINAALRSTEQLSLVLQQAQVPLKSQAEDLVRRGEGAVRGSESQDLAKTTVQKQVLDQVNQQFKTSADALLPLVKSNVLLQAYKKTLTDWHDALKEDYAATLHSLVVRLTILAGVVAVVMIIFTLWRRAVLHYVSDLRRRYQLLLLRRIALWSVVSLLLVLVLLNQLRSLATFAGLLSAGIAVALQSVFLAVIGYFLLIGKFGVKVGDRVQVSGVVGEIVDIGLLRLHVMELGGDEPNAQPTGRSIAFSNAVVFQAAAGLFRQVPEAQFLWREIVLTFSSDTSFERVEDRIAAAAKNAFETYRKDLELIRSRIELNLSSVSIVDLEPTVRYSLTSGGIEARLRLPVLQKNVGEIDNRIHHELLRAIRSEPELTIVRAEVSPMRVNLKKE